MDVELSGQDRASEPAHTGALALVLRQLVLATGYVLAARAGLMMDAVSGFATLVWPGTGIALVCLLRGGFRLWPGVFVGALVVNVWAGAPWWVAGGIATGNTLEAVLGAFLLRRVGVNPSLGRVSDVLSLVFLAALLSTFVSAAIGVASLQLGGIVPTDKLLPTWRAWWLGDAIGDLVLAPLLLTWGTRSSRRASLRRRLEALALLGVVLALGWLIFDASPGAPGAELRQSHMLFAPLIWAALRFERRGASAVTFLGALLAIAGAARGHGPFMHSRLSESLLELQGFMVNVAITGLFLAAVISERRRALSALHRQSNFLSAITDSTSDAIFIKDLKGRYELINPAAAQFVGKQVRDLLGKDDTALFPPTDARNVMTGDRAIMESGHAHTYEEPITIDGRLVTFSSVKAPYRDEHGAVIGLVGISRDISDRKAAEQRAQDAIALRDEFLSIASHELRTPLSALILLLGNLQRVVHEVAVVEGERARVGERISKAVRVGKRLSLLIDSLLDVSRLGSGMLELRMERCDLAELASETAERMAFDAQRAGCELQVSATQKVEGCWDPLRIEQVVTNLLSNAIKYGAGAPIQLRVESGAEQALLSVTDHGIGLDPADSERIFTRFERAVPLRNYGGLGLGLYIAREIVRAHAGTIAVNSELGQGATFTVALPRSS